MNAIVRHPALGAAETLRAAEAIVATMATIIRNRVELNGACTEDDLAQNGFTAAEIAEYGPIARGRVAPGLIRAGLVEDLTDVPERDDGAPTQAAQFQPAEPLPFALPLKVVAGVGCTLLEAADGQVLVRSNSMSAAQKAALDGIARACNAWPVTGATGARA